MTPAALVLALLTSASAATAAPGAPQTSAKPKVAGVPQVKLKSQATPHGMPGIALFKAGGGHAMPHAMNVDKVSVSAQQPRDGTAFMLANKATVIAGEANGLIDRGAHLGKESAFAVVVPRSWVGSHDLLFECTGELPTKVQGSVMLLHDSGFNTYGQVTVSPVAGKVKFLLMTSEMGGGNWVSVQIHNDDYQSSSAWRVDGCSVERM